MFLDKDLCHCFAYHRCAPPFCLSLSSVPELLSQYSSYGSSFKILIVPRFLSYSRDSKLNKAGAVLAWLEFLPVSRLPHRFHLFRRHSPNHSLHIHIPLPHVNSSGLGQNPNFSSHSSLFSFSSLKPRAKITHLKSSYKLTLALSTHSSHDLTLETHPTYRYETSRRVSSSHALELALADTFQAENSEAGAACLVLREAASLWR